MVSRVSPWLLALGFLGLAIGAMVMPLGQEKVPPYAFLFDRNEAKNDQQRFLNAVVADSGVSREELQPLLTRMRPLESVLPVALFVSRESGHPLEEVVDFRKSQRFWLDVFKKVGLKPKALFEGVDGKAPEPYKAAWTEYRMKRDPELSDAQVRELVLLQLAHRVSGQQTADIAKETAKGRSIEEILARPKPTRASATPAPAKRADSHAKGKHGGAHAR